MLAAVTLVAATACGTDADSGGAHAACSSSPGVTSDAIKVGLIYPGTGPAASTFSAFESGLQARFAVENAKGGVNGRRLEYVWRDDASSNDRNLLAAKALVERERVFSVLELTTASVGSAKYLHAQGVPVFGPGIEPSWATFDNMFSWATYLSPKSSTTTWGQFVQAHGGTKAAVIGVFADPIGRIGSEALAQSMRAAGVQVVTKIDIMGNGLDAALALQKIEASGADTIVGQFFVDPTVSLLQRIRADGLSFKVILGTTNLYDSAILQQFGPVLDGMYVYTDTVPFELNLPVHHAFRQAMAQYSPESQPPEQATAVNGWIVADMFVEGALRAGDCPDRSALIRNLRQVHDYTAGGFLPGPRDFATFRDISPCYSFVRFTPTAYSVQNPSNICGTVIPLS